jgi:hypothetical protein
MIGIGFVILSLVFPLAHLAIGKEPRTKTRIVDLSLLYYSLVFNVGFVGLFFGFIPHVFFADCTAHAIGWATGFHDGAWGVLGSSCIWVRGRMWLATGLGWSFFMAGAAIGYRRDALVNDNYAPNNFLMIFVDGSIAVTLLSLLHPQRRWALRPEVR